MAYAQSSAASLVAKKSLDKYLATASLEVFQQCAKCERSIAILAEMQINWREC